MRTQVQKYTGSALGHGGSADGLEVLMPGTVIDEDLKVCRSLGGAVKHISVPVLIDISLRNDGTLLSFRV